MFRIIKKITNLFSKTSKEPEVFENEPTPSEQQPTVPQKRNMRQTSIKRKRPMQPAKQEPIGVTVKGTKAPRMRFTPNMIRLVEIFQTDPEKELSANFLAQHSKLKLERVYYALTRLRIAGVVQSTTRPWWKLVPESLVSDDNTTAEWRAVVCKWDDLPTPSKIAEMTNHLNSNVNVVTFIKRWRMAPKTYSEFLLKHPTLFTRQNLPKINFTSLRRNIVDDLRKIDKVKYSAENGYFRDLEEFNASLYQTLCEHPGITYEELEHHFSGHYNVVKTSIRRMCKQGKIRRTNRGYEHAFYVI